MAYCEEVLGKVEFGWRLVVAFYAGIGQNAVSISYFGCGDLFRLLVNGFPSYDSLFSSVYLKSTIKTFPFFKKIYSS